MAEAVAQRCRQTIQCFVLLDGIIDKAADLSMSTERRIRPLRACFTRFDPKLYDMKNTPISLKVHKLKVAVIEKSLYRCSTLALTAQHFFTRLEHVRHQVLLRVIDFQNLQRGNYATLSYAPRPSSRHDARVSKRQSVDSVSSLRGGVARQHKG